MCIFSELTLVSYHLVFCQKKQENLCVFAPLREAIWVAGIARVRGLSLINSWQHDFEGFPKSLRLCVRPFY
jgi:hypothetical protein